MKDLNQKVEQEIKREELFMKFMMGIKVFIVDPSPASRARLMKIVVEIGAKPHLVTTFSGFEEVQALAKENPDIVISEYHLKEKSGFDLLQSLRKHRGNEKSLFVLVTANSSQSLVAQAAEEDIDAYILKPYTQESLKQSLISAAMLKFFPSDYAISIDEGKKLLFAGKAAEAKVFFKKAIALNEKPSLACFYYGQAEFMENSLGSAEEKYIEGLSYNKIHYKCLTHLFDLLHSMNRFEEAYDVIKQIATYFPANPKRLSTVLRLAIMTDHFEDIEKYYELFTTIENRTEELIRYICAAMITGARYYLLNSLNEKAIFLFQKVKITAAGREKYLLYIIQHLFEFSLENHAHEFFERFSPENYGSSEYKISEFLMKTINLKPEEVFKLCSQMISNKTSSYIIHFLSIKALLTLGRKKEASVLLEEASFIYPDKALAFKRLF